MKALTRKPKNKFLVGVLLFKKHFFVKTKHIYKKHQLNSRINGSSSVFPPFFLRFFSPNAQTNGLLGAFRLRPEERNAFTKILDDSLVSFRRSLLAAAFPKEEERIGRGGWGGLVCFFLFFWGGGFWGLVLVWGWSFFFFFWVGAFGGLVWFGDGVFFFFFLGGGFWGLGLVWGWSFFFFFGGFGGGSFLFGLEFFVLGGGLGGGFLFCLGRSFFLGGVVWFGWGLVGSELVGLGWSVLLLFFLGVCWVWVGGFEFFCSRMMGTSTV